jgi:hypothetical protein
MKRVRYLLLWLLTFAAASIAFAVTLPPGTVLPTMLSTKLDSGTKPGKKIQATIMQDVAHSGGKIPEQSKVIGHVVSVSKNEIAIQFDSLHWHDQVIPIITSLRAIASPMDVDDARTPTTGPDFGTSTADWNTIQIGGQAAYRRSVLMDDGREVGKVLLDGSTLAPLEASSRGCSGGTTTQALWVFSSDACGVYGYSDLSIAHAGKHAPVGQIVLRSTGKILVRAGSGLLLRVCADHNADPRSPR